MAEFPVVIQDPMVWRQVRRTSGGGLPDGGS